jgi:hypothetical protein
MITTNPLRCDALILTSDPAAPVLLVALGDLTEEDLHRQLGRLLQAQEVIRGPLSDDAGFISAQRDLHQVLRWMWDVITGPVLTALGHEAAPADAQSWPRVWWCPVGVVAYLPLHAAGHHDDLAARPDNPRTVLDRVISSYTSTIRGLAYARAQPLGQRAAKTLIVAVPDAPGAPLLPGAAEEAARLADLIPGAYRLPRPTRDSVLAALPEHAVAHFACHGYADWANPAASRLVLYDDKPPLTVADISTLQLSAGLAFLSACDTTVTKPALSNEAVHITGAFQLAGYQSVIGTLWSIQDSTARDLACDVYTHLTKGRAGPPSSAGAAQALHYASRELRDRYPGEPSLWAPYIHAGT